ncbi:DUF2231 domain-containing protein [Candidatus Sulfurimonas baltica]|uniref:DUF2231 domain-containing protein n=1 Tax=Candidatus Sulfurimonas baltica TaxID=2740404 RepID=A0A7S7LUH4_9BACT|nr:DUF2231 domain-containing protein [Candidatus Sulfurimonas baltica]QOY51535.1 hypothetical protein HUE88_10495 [Candidatus Sulfurimonas baltica]
MIHPAVAHFAVSLPIISLVLGLLYLFKPTEIMSKISTRFIAFAAVFVVIAYFTGKEDGSEVYKFLSIEGKELLKEHAQLGLYLAISMTIVALVKIFGCFKNIFKVEIFAVVLLALISAGILSQGKIGGELTYSYGAHVKDHAEGRACLAENSMDD